MMNAATRLLEHLTKHGLSQREFAAAIGRKKAQQSVSNWVHRVKRPDFRNAIAIERLTGIPAAEWLSVPLRSKREKAKGARVRASAKKAA